MKNSILIDIDKSLSLWIDIECIKLIKTVVLRKASELSRANVNLLAMKFMKLLPASKKSDTKMYREVVID